MRKKYTGLETLHLFLDRAHNSHQIEAEYSQPEKGKENGTLLWAKRTASSLFSPPSEYLNPYLPKKKFLSVQSYLSIGISLLCLVFS